MTFESHSQVGQDRWAYEICGRRQDGWFLDIGCGDPISNNNSYGLEQIGWNGIIVDRYPDPKRDEIRKCHKIVADAITLNWKGILTECPMVFQYLSIDCDENSFEVLSRLPFKTTAFKCITIEHDKYLRGPSLQAAEQRFLLDRGYTLVCEDVKWEGNPFEDWWTHSLLVTPDEVERFRCKEVNGLDIVSRS